MFDFNSNANCFWMVPFLTSNECTRKVQRFYQTHGIKITFFYYYMHWFVRINHFYDHHCKVLALAIDNFMFVNKTECAYNLQLLFRCQKWIRVETLHEYKTCWFFHANIANILV